MGFPTIEETKPLIKTMAEAGADMIELGIPFSDPLADGPTIQEASQIALENGVTLEKSIALVKELRQEGVNTPFLFMGYANPFLKFGLKKLSEELEQIAVDGLIVPDLPPSEAQIWVDHLKPKGIDLIFFLSPNTKEGRMADVVKHGSGFIYCVSLTGVTGARSELNPELDGFLKRVRDKTSLPLAVGFGISTNEHVKTVSKWADGVIMASALLAKLKDLPKGERGDYLKEAISTFKAQTKRA